MTHGPHDNCLMCSMARAIGMMKQHPANCDCQEKRKEKEDKKIKSEAYA